MPTSPIVIALTILTIGICLLALWKGGRAEQIGAGLILANATFSGVTGFLFPNSDLAVVWLVGDGVAAAGLLIVAVVYASFWLGGVMMLYAILFALHSYYFVTAREVDLFHARVNNIDFLAISVCLAIGTALSWRKRVVARRRTPTPQARPPEV